MKSTGTWRKVVVKIDMRRATALILSGVPLENLFYDLLKEEMP